MGLFITCYTVRNVKPYDIMKVNENAVYTIQVFHI